MGVDVRLFDEALEEQGRGDDPAKGAFEIWFTSAMREASISS